VRTDKVRFGLSLPNRGVLIGAATARDLLDTAVAAEETGFFDSVWVGDSLFHKPRLEAMVTLAAIVGQTRRVRLGTVCLATFVIRHPIWVASQWASLDVISEGRAVLGVCLGGGMPNELAPFGVSTNERVGRMTEGIEILRQLWAGDRVSHSGKYYQFSDLSLAPKPVQNPCPIWIASNPKGRVADSEVVQRAMRRIGRLGDGYMTDNIPPQEFAARWKVITDTARAAGRDPARLESSLHLMVNINDDPAKAYDEARRFLKFYYSFDPSPELMEGWVAYGPPDAVSRKIMTYVEAGCTVPILRFAAFDQLRQLERAAERVMPHLARVS
jgi:alkanesulfonate monooxygenase SsuD/methylene tetrahydromethanopterin reductase-like flavin-dependent oxidoreductase (luciferase family)